MRRFQDLAEYTIHDLHNALERNDPGELHLVSITVALTSNDVVLAENVCSLLCLHPDRDVRANALISLGHLARRFRRLDEPHVKHLIEVALKEEDDYIRGQAKSAADEVHQFLGWTIEGHIYG